MIKRLLFWRCKVDPAGTPQPELSRVESTNHDMESNAVVQWSQRWLIDFIDAFLMRWCQFSLMIGCILGTFGLYATSFNLTAQPAFNGIWAGIQAVSIDGLFFAVWSVWRRSTGKGWLRTWYFFIGVLLMVVAAMVNGVVSYTELHKVATIALTMQELHINETVFSWSRSVLVVLVAVLITTLPRGSKVEQLAPVEQSQNEVEEIKPPIDFEKVLETMVTMNQQTLQAVQEQNNQAMNVTIERVINITVEAVKEAVASLPIGGPLPQIEAPEEVSEPSVKMDETEVLEADEKPTYRSDFAGNYGDKVEALLQEQPDLNGKQIAELVGCSERTAYKWKNRIQVITPLEGN